MATGVLAFSAGIVLGACEVATNGTQSLLDDAGEPTDVSRPVDDAPLAFDAPSSSGRSSVSNRGGGGDGGAAVSDDAVAPGPGSCPNGACSLPSVSSGDASSAPPGPGSAEVRMGFQGHDAGHPMGDPGGNSGPDERDAGHGMGDPNH